MAGQLIIHSTDCSGNWGQQKYKRLQEIGTLSSPQRSKRVQYKPVDDFDKVVIRNNVQEFCTYRHQLPTINNLFSVLKTDIMSTIH